VPDLKVETQIYDTI